MNQNEIGKHIEELRKKKGLTQKELGEKIGVKHNTVSGYENATNEAEQDILFKIANVLEISINDLFPPTTSSVSLTNAEIEHIKNYRQLDTDGKAEIDIIINAKLQLQESKSKGTQNKAG